MAESVLDKLVKVKVAPAPKATVKGKPIFKVTIENGSPLLLNGLALQSKTDKDSAIPKVLTGIAIAPHRTMTIPATDEAVKSLGLKTGARLIAAELSGL